MSDSIPNISESDLVIDEKLENKAVIEENDFDMEIHISSSEDTGRELTDVVIDDFLGKESELEPKVGVGSSAVAITVRYPRIENLSLWARKRN